MLVVSPYKGQPNSAPQDDLWQGQITTSMVEMEKFRTETWYINFNRALVHAGLYKPDRSIHTALAHVRVIFSTPFLHAIAGNVPLVRVSLTGVL